MNVRGLPLSREKICSLASIVRKQCGVGNNLYFPVVQVIEWGLCGSDEFNYIIVLDDEMCDIYGTAYIVELHITSIITVISGIIITIYALYLNFRIK